MACFRSLMTAGYWQQWLRLSVSWPILATCLSTQALAVYHFCPWVWASKARREHAYPGDETWQSSFAAVNILFTLFTISSSSLSLSLFVYLFGSCAWNERGYVFLHATVVAVVDDAYAAAVVLLAVHVKHSNREKITTTLSLHCC